MSMVAGLWECELDRIVQKLQAGSAARVMNDDGSETIVRVKGLDPARFGSNLYCY